MRILGIVLLALLGLYAAGIGVLAFYQRHLIYPGVYDPPRQDRSVPEGVQQITLQTNDGQSLHALWLPPKPGGGVVLTFHGNGSLPEPHAARFAEPPWREHGWGVLAFAYRGYPGSTGSPTETGLIEDGLTAYRFIAENAPGSAVLLHGHSLGTAIAVAVAEREPHIGLYLEAPFDSMRHVARLHMPRWIPTDLFLLDTYRSDQRIAKSPQPVMIVQGDDDDIVPAKLALRLAKAAGSRARIAVIPGDHVSILGERDAEAEAFFRGFLAKGRADAPQPVAP